MPEALPRPDTRALEVTALRYAARDLPPPEAEAFESRLADDQTARDALAEAVRLSAAALGQDLPTPDRSFRKLIRDRLRPVRAWFPPWLARRAYRGHPFAWVSLGAGVVAASTLVGLTLAVKSPEPSESLAQRPAVMASPSTHPTVTSGGEVEPGPDVQLTPFSAADGSHIAAEGGHAGSCNPDESILKEAEIWAELSTPDHVEKTHSDEARWRQHLRDLHAAHPVHAVRADAVTANEP